MAFKIREMREEEYPLLSDFLYEAIYVPKGVEKPPKSIIDRPELQVYIENFGRKGDTCMVAEADGKVVAAAWARIMKSYGYVDDQTPTIALSMLEDYRNQGIGPILMRKMIESLMEQGYQKVSLSVQKENKPAMRLYRNAGFKTVRENDVEAVLARNIP